MIVENIIPLVLILIVTVIMVILTRYGCKLMDNYSKVSNERSKERLKERRERREYAKREKKMPIRLVKQVQISIRRK